MILNLLEQAGLSARIDGEYLQGGVGELQAIGIVRVMIEDSEYSEARKIVQEWDAKQPAEIERPKIKKTSSFGSGLIGFVLGIGIMIAYYHTPVTDDGIDYNGDGKLDEKWTYVNYRISKTELDRNFDGTIDFIYSFDRRGIIRSSLSDEDFNGTFETDIHYEYGSAVWQKSDSTGDGFKDYVVNFKSGVTDTVTFINPVTKRKIKVQKFGPFGLIEAELDSSGDGVIDTFYIYDSIEEVAKKSNKHSQQDAPDGAPLL